MPFLRERRWFVASTTEKQVDKFIFADDADQFPHGAEDQKEYGQPQPFFQVKPFSLITPG